MLHMLGLYSNVCCDQETPAKLADQAKLHRAYTHTLMTLCCMYVQSLTKRVAMHCMIMPALLGGGGQTLNVCRVRTGPVPPQH